MAETDPNSSGLVNRARRVLDSGLALAQNRLELVSVELQEEKHRLVELLLWAMLAAVGGVLALVTGTLAVVVLFWDTARELVLAGCAVFYLALALGAFTMLRRRWIKSPPPFATSLDELRKDRGCLHAKN